jgi:hypothetical protein
VKKKILVLALCLTLFSVFNASAYTAAIGGEFSMPLLGGLPNSALLSFRLPKFPAVFGLGLNIPTNGGSAAFALIADWWLVQGPLVGFVNYYVGPGVFMGVSANDFTLGLRVPIGLNAFPIKPLELFVEFAPAIAFLAPSGISIPNFNLQAGFGFRFWF